MIKENEVIDHTIRIDFTITEGDFDIDIANEPHKKYMEEAAIRMLFCFGYFNIKGVEISKIES